MGGPLYHVEQCVDIDLDTQTAGSSSAVQDRMNMYQLVSIDGITWATLEVFGNFTTGL